MNVQTAELVCSVHRPDQLPRDGRPEIAFVGRSNVGKSSLLNRLLRRRNLARTSSTPGRTQAINVFVINDKFYFVDLPGYGYAKVSKQERQRWATLMDSYFRHLASDRAPKSLLILLVDGKIAGTELDQQAHDYLSSMGHEPLVVATKIDKVSRGRRARTLGAIRQRLTLPEEREVLSLSATSGEGIGTLWKAIMTFLDSKPQSQRVDKP